jgi:sodium-dependent phosphate transporter
MSVLAVKPSFTSSATGFSVPFKPSQFVLPINKNALPFGAPINGSMKGLVEFTFEHDYYWIVIAGGIFAFGAAYGLGANDVANAFGTSVGSKSLRLVHAIMIASIFEFLGALLLGAATSKTISGGIAKPEVFSGHGDVFMLGMLGVLVANTIWQLVATRLDLNVSSTHSVVGAVLGFCLVWSPDSANWDKVTEIVISWFISPVLAGVMAALYFLMARTFLLRHGENSFKRVLAFFPVLVFFAVSINALFVGLKSFGTLTIDGKAWGAPVYSTDGKNTMTAGNTLFYPVTIGGSFGVGLFFALLVRVIVIPAIRRKIEPLDDSTVYGANIDSAVVDAGGSVGKPSGKDGDAVVAVSDGEPTDVDGSASFTQHSPKKNFLARYADRQDELVHGDKYKSETVQHIWEEGEVFPYRAERVFNYLQIFTAILASFAHGAGDVSHSVGPFSAIMSLYQTNGAVPGTTNNKLVWPTDAAYASVGVSPRPDFSGPAGTTFKSFPIPIWLLAMGGVGIVLGMATYGYRLMRATGVGFIKMTPSRGACAELGFVSVIIVGAVTGIPLSSSHCITGAIIGVGMVERGCSRHAKSSINWVLLLKYMASWVLTIFIAGGISAFIFAFAIYSPARNISATAENCVANGLLTNFAKSYTVSQTFLPNTTIISMSQSGTFYFN